MSKPAELNVSFKPGIFANANISFVPSFTILPDSHFTFEHLPVLIFNKYETNATSRRSNWGLNGGITVGINLWDGNRRREKRNASLQIRNSQLEREQLELGLKADLSNLWQAYRNNLRLLNLERQNLVAARENHEIAKERYLLGDLSGIEMREAQKSLLDAEERILSAEYNTKVCEISLLQLSGRITKYLE